MLEDARREVGNFPARGPARLVAVDWARGLALLGMAVFHFARDLEMFGLVPAGTTLQGGWAVFARTVAASFLALAGVSLWLAHGRGIRWRAFGRRLARIAAAAALVSVATFALFPDRFVYFGILHSIAVCSVIGLAFLRLPAGAILAAAAAVLAVPRLFRSDAFDAPWLWWTGLSPQVRPTLDFEPVFPWLAAFLAGLAAAKAADRAGLLSALGRAAPGEGRLSRALAWPGRHSLAVYLLHQPVLIALIWLWTRIA